MKETRNREDEDFGSDRDTLYLIGGLALLAFGAGLVLTNKNVRKFMGSQGKTGRGILSAAIPDFERYMKLRSM